MEDLRSAQDHVDIEPVEADGLDLGGARAPLYRVATLLDGLSAYDAVFEPAPRRIAGPGLRTAPRHPGRVAGTPADTHAQIKETTMSESLSLTAPNLSIEADGHTFAYRRFGKAGGVPLLFLQHFRGGLDSWDPSLVDSVASEREVVLLDNTGVGLSGGRTPNTVGQMARDAISFVDALGLEETDVLGFSLGGFVAQDMALLRPLLVRRVVLAGTGPQGGPLMHGWRKDIADAARKPDIGGAELLYIFFKHTETSQAKGVEYLGRFLERQQDRDPLSTIQTRDAQYDAVLDWGIPDHGKLQRLAAIRQPTFVANGDMDLMIPPKLTHLMAGLIPDAEVKIYPDSAHAFLFQYPVEFAADVNAFLSR